MRPKLLYKYKSISTIEDLSRVLDIIRNNSIYFPTYDQLNDPLEGAGYNIEIEPWAGISIAIAEDRELRPIREKKKEFRILSLSSGPMSPQLWAHYTNNYSGICLCFATDKCFAKAKCVKYVENDSIPQKRNIYEDDELQKAVYDNFFYKQEGWSYEKEWRIVERNTTSPCFFTFKNRDLVGIILGNRLDSNIQSIICNSIPKDMKVLKALPGHQTFRINLLPWDYEYPGSGRKPDYITDVESYCLK